MENPSDQAAAAASATREKKRKKPDPLIGRTVGGRYVINDKIGVGGMGVVYKAKQGAVDRDIAVKVLIPEKLGGGGDNDETLIRRFHLEARAASKLAHPNTITIYDFGRDEDGLLYIAMEFLDGVPLDKVLRQGPMDPSRAVRIMLQICSSLAEAHKKGIIHRDIKPDNIFLIEVGGEQDFVKVLDFGVAKMRGGGESKEKTLTQAGMIFGTPKYMSPEQARCLPLDPRSDIYALGVLMYQMLVGEVPFDADDHVSVLLMHCSEPPPAMQDKLPDMDIPAELEAIVFKALVKDRDHRYQSTDEMAAALDAIATKLEWVPRTSIMPVVTRTTTPTPIPSPGLETPSPTASTLDGLSEPLMGRTSPEEAGLTPSGSVDWDGDLNLDLGVTPVDRPTTQREGPTPTMIAGIAGAVGLVIALLVVALVVIIPGEEPPPADPPEVIENAPPPETKPDPIAAVAPVADAGLEADPDAAALVDAAEGAVAVEEKGTDPPTNDDKAPADAKEPDDKPAARVEAKPKDDTKPRADTKPKDDDDKRPSVTSLLDSVKTDPKKPGDKKPAETKPGDKKPGDKKPAGFEDDPWANDK